MNRWLYLPCIGILFSLSITAAANDDLTPKDESNIEGTEQFEYRTVGKRKLSIYVRQPTQRNSSKLAPAIVFFHGGGWTGGKPGQFTEHARYFAERGVACFQVEYRLLAKKNSNPPLTCLQDARAAIRWVRQHADDFKIDPNRIASAGGSAGGHLAACLGTRVTTSSELFGDSEAEKKINSRSNAMLLFNPVYDNGPDDGWGTKRVGDQFSKYSAAHNIDKQTPPAVVFLGDDDKLVPVSVAKRFQQKMKDLHIESRLTIFPGMPHGFFNHGKYDNKPFHQTLLESDRFLIDLGWLTGEPQPAKFPK